VFGGAQTRAYTRAELPIAKKLNMTENARLALEK